jgi:hydroxyacylglutathione hydrolase
MNIIDFFSMHVGPLMFRGKGFFHPCESGQLSSRVSCIREYDVNIFFYTKNGITIAIDSGYKNYNELAKELESLHIDSSDILALFLTHVDMDHGGGVDSRCTNFFLKSQIYLGEKEENYLTNTFCRKKIAFLKFRNSIRINHGYFLLKDGQIVNIGGIKVQAFLTPGHTLGHMSYLIDDELLFVGDALALNKQGGYCFFDFFNVDSRMNIKSLERLKKIAKEKQCKAVYTAHNGYTNDIACAFKL